MADVSQIVLKDANGNVIGTYDVKDASVPHDSKAAASGGTTLSLVTTGEKATWNAKSNLTLGTTSTTALKGDTKYAGSSSAGGSATSAVKLDTATAGSATQPCYFTSGKPSACTYSLSKSVPSNAVFTDTNNAVTQTATSANAYYEVLFSVTADNTTRTEGARKSSNLRFNPSTGNLTTTLINSAKWAERISLGPLSANSTVVYTIGSDNPLYSSSGAYLLSFASGYGVGGLYLVRINSQGSGGMIIATIVASSYITVQTNTWNSFKVTTGQASFVPNLIQIA